MGLFPSRVVLTLPAVMVLLFAGCSTAPKGPVASPDVVAGASLAAEGRPDLAGELTPVETGKKVLVVYFSQGTATRRVAEDLATLLGADLERIVEKKDRSGPFGFLVAGADSSQKLSTPIEPPTRSPGDYGLVVVCTQVWAWSLAPPVRSWLQLQASQLPDCVFVEVSAATEPKAIVAMMVEASGGKQPLASEGFVEADFAPENKSIYLGKLEGILGKLR